MSIAWRFAWRDLRSGGRGLWLLALCLFLGTAALAGIGSLSAGILTALDAQQRMSLGGDLELKVSQRRATVEEQAAIAARGILSETVSLRGMAETPGRSPVLIDLKAVDARWPMVGRLRLEPGALRARPERREVVIAPALAQRLGVGVGGSVRIGAARFRIVGLIAEEPDQLGEGFRIGPVAILDLAGLEASDLLQPGSLYTSRYRLALPAGADARAIGQGLMRRFANAGWSMRLPYDATNTLRRGIDQLGQFLLLVGLAALAIAGLGVGSGVGAYLGARTRMVATLKVLGARSRLVTAMFLIELVMVATLSIAIGLLVGTALPAFVRAVAGDALPIPPALGIYPKPLLVAAALDVMVALLFSLPALARSRSVPAATLLRDMPLDRRTWTWPIVAATGALVAGIVALAVLTASDRLLALGFAGATLALIAGLALLGLLLRHGLARLPRPRRPLARLALANLHRPGAQTWRLVIALGLGFSLFVALAVIDTSLTGEMREVAPAKAPRFFAMDLQPEDAAAFRAAVTRAAPDARIETTPSLRGSITAIKGQRIADMRPPPTSWVLRGDRTITWAATLPPRNRIVAGRWWPADYHGPPLVSLGSDVATALGLRVGDEITVSVLGVDVPARIAALRTIDWSAMGLNFAIIFSPGYIEEAPHGLLASVSAGGGHDGAIAGAVASALPSVTMVRVADIIGQIGDLLGRIGLAIRSAAAVTVVAGLAVLTGAITASNRTRGRDAVLLKLLGGTRRQVLAVHALEYGFLAVLLSGIALLVGAGGGWFVVTRVLALPFAPDWRIVGATLLAAAAVTMGFGVGGTLPILRLRAAEGLRA